MGKTKEWIYLQGTLDIEFEWDWSVGLGTTLSNSHAGKLIVFSVPGKADFVMVLGFKCAIIPQALMKFIGAIFEKI